MPVLGICNGFQILCESHLLPGALIRNDHRKFVCRDQRLRIENNRTPGPRPTTRAPRSPIVLKNGEGGYVADDATLDRLEGEGRVVARYLDDNPNGSLRDIAGITNERGNVVGLMPHPEHAVEDLTGSGTDGLGFFTSLAATSLSARRYPLAGRRRPQPRPTRTRGYPARAAASRPARPRRRRTPVARQADLVLPGAHGGRGGGVEDAGDREPRPAVAALSARWSRRTSAPAEPNLSTGRRAGGEQAPSSAARRPGRPSVRCRGAVCQASTAASVRLGRRRPLSVPA